MTRVLFLAMTLSLAFSAEGRERCTFDGKFQNIVFDSVGAKRAMEETSYGLALIDRKTGDILCQEYVQPDRNIYPASTIKTLVAIALLRKIDRGDIRLADRVAIDQPNANDECAPWNCKIYGNGKMLTVEKLLWDMITVSNNLATNQLIDAVSKDFINRTAVLAEAPSLRVYRKVYSTVDPEPEIKTPNTSTARGFTQLFREIATGRLGILTESSRNLMIEILRQQKINGSLNYYFPKDVIFYHKTGNTSKATADSGFFHVKDGVVAILVGLQNFNKYDGGKSGFDALRKAGKETLELVLSGF